jgi:CheY-like chemotaxis protein
MMHDAMTGRIFETRQSSRHILHHDCAAPGSSSLVGPGLQKPIIALAVHLGIDRRRDISVNFSRLPRAARAWQRRKLPMSSNRLLARLSRVHADLSAAYLTGRSILVVEDEPLIALEIDEGLKRSGAKVITAWELPCALKLATDADLSAAVIDYKIGDADSSKLCRLLKERQIPFLIYSGYDIVEGQWPDVTVIQSNGP